MARSSSKMAEVSNHHRRPQKKFLVLTGGLLINPGAQAPIPDATIVIEGDRVQSVGRRDDLPIPKGSRVIDAAGKTILPGFLDGHGHYEDFAGEIYLHLGITTCPDIEIFRDDYWSLAQKHGIRLGKIRGPRLWTAGRGLGDRKSVV